MEYVYDFEVPSEEPTHHINEIQREISRIGGVVTATGPGSANTDHVVLVAHNDRDMLATFIREYYELGGFDEDQIKLELLKIREA